MKTLASAMLLMALIGTSFVVADESAPKTEATPKPEAAPEAKPFDRGDAAAEKALKRAYVRVASAEAKGLERMLAEAKVTFDLSKSKLPLKVPPCEGRLTWQAGHTPYLDLDDPQSGYRISLYCENAFQPYVFFVFGLPGWDNFFKEANFKFVEAPKNIPEDGAKDKFIAVKFSDVSRGIQTYQVRDTTIIAVNFEMDIMESPATARLIFTYEDKGKDLRIIQIDTDADVMMAVPDDEEETPKEAEKPKEGEEKPKEGEEAPAKPVKPAKKKTNIQQTVKLTEYATAGKAEICSKMEAEISVDFRATKLEFPATLELKNIKANKDVSDDDLKPMLIIEEIRTKARAKDKQDAPKEDAKPKDGGVKPKDPDEKDF